MAETSHYFDVSVTPNQLSHALLLRNLNTKTLLAGACLIIIVVLMVMVK